MNDQHLAEQASGSPALNRRTFLYGGLAASLIGLTACSGAGPTGTDGTGGSTPVTDPTGDQTAATAPSEVIIAQSVDPTTMDPMQQRETTTQNVLLHVYDTLLVRSGADSTKFEPNIAQSWEMVDDTTMELTLADGVTFSDGSALTSADVVYSFDYLLGQGDFTDPAIAAYQYGTIDSVTAVDEKTVRIVTKAPDVLLEARLCRLFVIKDGALASDPEALASTPLGTGPYTMTTWDRNAQVVLEAREDYHRGTPDVKKVTFRTLPEPAARLAAIMSGDVDLITALPADNVAEVEGSGNAVIKTVPSARVASIWLNAIGDGPMAEPKVRLALNHAINVDQIIESVMSGYGQRVATFVPEYFAGYDPAVQPIPYDPEQAKTLLAEAGYGDGFEFSILVPEGRYAFASEVTQAMIPMLAEVGVTLNIDTVEFGVFAERTQSRDIGDAFYGAWGNAFFSPIDELNVAVVTGDAGFSWYSNAKVDELTAQAGQTLDQTEQTAIITRIQEELLADPVFIYLFAYVDIYGVNKDLAWEPRADELLLMFDPTTS